MEFDIKKYLLHEQNYLINGAPKNKIVIGNVYQYSLECVIESAIQTYNSKMDYPHYIINEFGDILQLIETKNHTKFVDIPNADVIINIGLLNMGRIMGADNEFYDVYNNKFNGVVIESEWKGANYWAFYHEPQLKALGWLCNKISKENNIPRNIQDSNVKKGDINTFFGICYRSNFNAKYYDITPAFEIEKFKKYFTEYL